MTLQVSNLHAFYGKSHVLHGVSLAVGKGEIVALLGRNGSGRSTTAKAIMGMVEAQGSVLWAGQNLVGRKPYEVAHLGIGYVPENRDIFPTLTVRQNLLLGQKSSRQTGRWAMSDMFAVFPRLEERADTPAGVLSGGEQQMLTIARTLMGNPRCVLLDEPSEGLAPIIVEQMATSIRTLKGEGLSVVLCEQNLHFALGVADRAYIIEKGQIRFGGSMAELAADAALREQYLSV